MSPTPEIPLSSAKLADAHERIRPLIHRTPVLTSRGLDALSGANLWFKCENFQKVGAFKARGALNTILQLTPEQKKVGVTTHSSGNHGQAVAWAAQREGIEAWIVVPENAPAVKRNAIASYGAHIVECPSTLADRETYMARLVAEKGLTPIHPYDDYRIIAGQASAATELFEETPELDYLICPVGGGGLLSGTLLSTYYHSPATRVIAGEPLGADDTYRSWKAGRLIPQVAPDTIADGLRTSLGEKGFPIIQKWIHDIVRVNDLEILRAMRLIWERMKVIIEPSCAVPLAVVLKQPDRFKDKKVGLILTGGNVDIVEVGKLLA